MADKHPLDVVAEQAEAEADAPVAAQDPSPDYWELHPSTDAAVVGDYPQAVHAEPRGSGESGGLGPDGFPAGPIPEQRLQKKARWTDVLSANLWDQAFLFNDKALAAFKGCDLGNSREYPVTVRDKTGARRPMTYLRTVNPVGPEAFDFGRSEFYVADMLGTPGPPVAVGSYEEWAEAKRKAFAGELEGFRRFSKVDHKRLVFLPGRAPAADLFTLAWTGVRGFVSARLKVAIESAGVTGLEIRPNKRLFAGR